MTRPHKAKRTKKRPPLTPAPFVRGVVVQDDSPDPEPVPVFVNRVTLDNTVPGGFRYEQVAVPQPARS